MGGRLEAYAGALVALRGYYAGVIERAPAELRWLRRIAHRIVDAALESEQMPRSALVLASTHRDPPARAVHTALLSALAAKQLSSDPEVLSRVVLAALLRGVGDSGEGDSRTQRPARLAALCLAVGGGCQGALPGVVAGFGAAWLDHDVLLGPMSELAPLVTSRIVHAAGQVVDALSQQERQLTPAEALREQLEQADADRECLCLLVSAVGSLPVGTIVELDNRAWGVVVEPGIDPERLDRPTVRLLTTDTGRALERAARAELHRTGSHGPQRAVRLVPPAFTRFNVVQALLE
jgi:hypothetical protein